MGGYFPITMNKTYGGTEIKFNGISVGWIMTSLNGTYNVTIRLTGQFTMDKKFKTAKEAIDFIKTYHQNIFLYDDVYYSNLEIV